VTGPAGSGKTHLAHVWAARSGAAILPAADLPGLDPGSVTEDAALAVEDVDRLAELGPDAARAVEEALFHLCNRLALGGGALMISGRSAPAFWPLALPDLRSRLEAAPVAALEAPDDALLGAVLVKLFADRGIGVGPEVIRYLLARMDRSFEAAEALVARLDAAGPRAGAARHDAAGGGGAGGAPVSARDLRLPPGALGSKRGTGGGARCWSLCRRRWWTPISWRARRDRGAACRTWTWLARTASSTAS
jgi:hypothetical protein